MLFEDFTGLYHTLTVGLFAYISLVIILRTTGKRTLSKMNAFDFIVTVALGSTLATVLLSKTVSLVEGITAFSLLAGAQYAITWTSVRSSRFRSWVKSEPRVLLRDGSLIAEAMRAERITIEEVDAAIRGAGYCDKGSINLVVLETDGSFSVVPTRNL